MGEEETSKISFIATSRGGRKLILDGYAYIKQRTGQAHSQWMCENKTSCSARLRLTLDETAWEKFGTHTHLPNHGKIKADRAMASLIEKVRLPDNYSEAIYIHMTYKKHTRCIKDTYSYTWEIGISYTNLPASLLFVIYKVISLLAISLFSAEESTVLLSWWQWMYQTMICLAWYNFNSSAVFSPK